MADIQKKENDSGESRPKKCNTPKSGIIYEKDGDDLIVRDVSTGKKTVLTKAQKELMERMEEDLMKALFGE